MSDLKLDSGLKHIAITRDGQDCGIIEFNPAEALFAERFYAVLGELNKKEKEYEDAIQELGQHPETDEMGIPLNTGEKIKLWKESCQFMREKIDYVFGPGTSQTAFGDALSFDVIGQFLEGITPYIETARQEKVSQYVRRNEPPKPKRRRR